MFSHFYTLLESVVRNPNEKVALLPILTQKQQHQITVEWNEAHCAYPCDRSVPTLFEEIVEKFPDKAALSFQGNSMSYCKLNEKANQLARHLQSLGIQKQDFVGIYLDRSDDLIIAILGILKTGAIYVPIDASYPMERKLFMIEHTGLKVLISQRSFIHQFSIH